jgi:Domain of unknown function (DUF4375)
MPITTAREVTWHALEARWEKLTFDGLKVEEKETIALFWLEGEVMNGGLIQFFSNSSGDLAPLAASALTRLGAHRSLELLKTAMSKLCPAGYAEDRKVRHGFLEQFGWGVDPFDAETRELQELPENFFGLALDDLASRYAQEHAQRLRLD